MFNNSFSINIKNFLYEIYAILDLTNTTFITIYWKPGFAANSSSVLKLETKSKTALSHYN